MQKGITNPAMLITLLAAFAPPAWGQGGNRAPTGGQTLTALSFGGAQLGTLPSGIDLLNGTIEAVDRNGQRMLRASSNATFFIQLPATLPQDFLIELELIPKVNVSSEDFHVEGTRDPDGGDESATLYWYSSNVKVVGGGSHFDEPMPRSLYGTLAGNLTTVAVSVHGRMMRVYANGQLTHTIPNHKFVRNPFVRVFLGGEDDDQNAVYLKSLRVANLGPTMVLSSTSSTSPTNTSGTSGTTGTGAAQPASGSSGSSSPNVISNLTVTDSPAGPVVNWSASSGALYSVQRWLVSDPSCCANGSLAPVSSPPWQDKPPPFSGTYLYSVTATTSAGAFAGQTQFSYTVPAATPTISVGTAPAKTPTTTIPFGPGTVSPQPPGGVSPTSGTTPSGSTSGGTSAPPSGSTPSGGNAPVALTSITLNDLWTQRGWGVMITSTSSFSGVSYRVHRTITGSGTPATVVKVIDFSALVSNGQMTLIDPYVWPGTGYTYWIEVVASDGTVSAPSPISTVNVGVFGAGLAGGMATFPAPVATTITGTKTITLFGQQGPGSDVTWTWNLTTGPVFVYHISYELNPSTSLVPGVGGMPIIRAEVPIQFTPPNAPGAPTFTMGVPQGQTARFCVWVYADPDLTKPLPQEKVCTDTRVP